MSARLEALGPPRLVRDGVDLLPRRRVELALLAYLALHAGRPVRREAIATLFWGDKPDELARQSLRQALVKLGRAVPDVIVRDMETVRVVSGTLSLDVAEVEELLQRGSLHEAIALWRGPLLEGADAAGSEGFQSWLGLERERLESLLASARERIALSPFRGAARPGSAALLTPDLVGREPIIAAIDAAWGAKAEGAVLLIEGGPGSGRTRLCAEARRRLKGATVLAIDSNAPLTDATQTPLAHLVSGLARLAGMAAASPAALAELAAIEPSAGVGRRLPERSGSVGAVTFAVRDALGAVAAESPVLLLVDNASRLSNGSLHVLLSLMRDPIPAVVLVVTADSDDAGSVEVIRAARESAVGRRVRLQRLAIGQISSLVASMLPISDADLGALAAMLDAGTAGVPLSIVEYVAALADSGRLELDRSGFWRLTGDAATRALPAPSSATGNRFSQLGPAAPRVAAAKERLDSAVTIPTIRSVAQTPKVVPAGGRRAAAVGALAAALLIVIAVASRGRRAAAAPVRPGSIVVLPFENHTGDPRLDPTGRMAAEQLTQGIVRFAAGDVLPVPADGVTSSAATAVAGSYHLEGDSLTFDARIVDVRTGTVHATLRSSRGLRSTPADAIDALRRSVHGALAAWSDPRIAAAARTGTVPPTYEGYRAMARGLDFLYAREGDRADAALLNAYHQDTTFTLPLLYAAFSRDGQNRFAGVDSILQALQPRREALTSYEQAIVDFLEQAVGSDLAARYTTARHAAAIAPGSMMAGYYYPRAAIGLNRPREAIAAMDRVDPRLDEIAGMPGYWSILSMALHMAGSYERQLAVGRDVEARLPRDTRGLYYQVRALAALGRTDELELVLSQGFLRPAGPTWDAVGLSLHVLAADELRAHGHPAAAQVLLRRVIEIYRRAPDSVQQVPRQRLELSRALLRAGQPAEARRMAIDLIQGGELTGQMLVVTYGLAGAAAAAEGDTVAALAADRWLQGAHPRYAFGESTARRARIAAMLGRRDDAVRLLRQAVLEGMPYDNNHHLDFELSRLSGYAPFEEWLRPKG